MGATIPNIVAMRSLGRDGTGFMARWSQPAEDAPKPALNALSIQVIKRRVNGAVDFGDGWRSGPFAVNDIAVVAPNTPTRIALSGANSGVAAFLEPARLTEQVELAASAGFMNLGRLHGNVFRDVRLARLVDDLWAADTDPGRAGQLYIDGLLLAVAGRLLALSETSPRQTPKTIGALEPNTWLRVQAYIQDHLDQNLALADLARCAGISPSHFIRAFKATTGQTPHRYLLNIRIDRARELIIHTRRPLVDIALETGFSSQAHMTTAFASALAVTPGKLRSS
jgi:AraC family transcriptional regulator